MMAFRVGQKVVFIGPNRPNNRYHQNVPVRGQVYTIRAIAEVLGQTAFLLMEVRNDPYPWANGFVELHIEAKFFRPVVERKTDISVFTEMLKTTKQPLVLGE
jgi:hypothetical protein